MKNKILVFTILFAIFLFPFVVLGQPAYERNPSGSEIENPVSFTLTNVFTEYPSCSSWHLKLTPATTSPCQTLTTDTWEVSLPLGEYTWLQGECFSSGNCTTGLEEQWDVEGIDNPDVIFEVIATPPPPYEGDFITITTSSLASTTAYVGDLFNSISPLVLLAIGVPLGFYIINQIIKFATLRKVKIKK